MNRLRRHPAWTALVSGHDRLQVANCSKITDFKQQAAFHKQKADFEF